MNNGDVLDLIVQNQGVKKDTISLYVIVKRVFDILVAAIGIIFLLPIALIVKIAYILNKDFNSIFFCQERIGKNGEMFKLYKFRTMVPNSAEILKELLMQKEYREEWKKKQKFNHDPRITRVGNILRKTSLDELPQLLNVLKGDMSFIGPRPLISGELDSHNGNHEIYEKVKPGITGWWACNGRSATTYEKRLELEYYYVKNCSLCLDIKCIFKTIKAVFRRVGVK